jgi:YesN/AraC family two-component response regulator
MVSGAGYKVLVVDDERFILDSLTGFLEDFEFEVSKADSAEKAIKLLEKTQVDIAVVDLRLPGMSGDLLIQKIHSLHPDIQFVIHTGSVGYVLSDELKAIGMTTKEVFFKPVPDLIDLVKTVLALVEKKIDN